MYLDEQLQFISDYKASSNAATGSKYDSNANVTEKNIATLAVELDKKAHIDLQRAVMKEYLLKMPNGEKLAKQYYKLTIEDRIERLSQKINLISNFIDVLK